MSIEKCPTCVSWYWDRRGWVRPQYAHLHLRSRLSDIPCSDPWHDADPAAYKPTCGTYFNSTEAGEVVEVVECMAPMFHEGKHQPPTPTPAKPPLGNPVYFSPTELDTYAQELAALGMCCIDRPLFEGRLAIEKYIEANFVPKKLYDELRFRMDGLEKWPL